MRTIEETRAAILSCIQADMAAKGVVASVTDDTDLRAAGLIDSLGFVRLLGELERVLGTSIDLSEADPTRLTHVGTMVRHLATQQSTTRRGKETRTE